MNRLVHKGDAPSIEFTIAAPEYAPLVASTAITFTRIDPDRTTTAFSSPNAAITGPIAGTTVVDGTTVTTTLWRWQMAEFEQSGSTRVRCRSTGGLLASIEERLLTPSSPFA